MDISLAKQLQEQMIAHQFVFSILGNLNQEFLKSIIKITDSKLTSLDVDKTMKNRIFHFMVECTQNLCRNEDESKTNNSSLFLIGKNEEDYVVHLGSIYNKQETERAISLIEKVNSIDSQEIKDAFYNEISQKEKSKENHMLLGLLSISKRIKDKILYDVFTVNDTTDFLSFKIIINVK